MRAIDEIVERRVEEGRAAGYFDDLAGAGKPIPDLDEQRPPGWWAQRFEKRERHQMLRDELEASVRQALPGLQRRGPRVRAAGVADLNLRIAGYNRVTTVEPLPPVDATTASWD